MSEVRETAAGLWDYIVLVAVFPWLLVMFILAGEKNVEDD